MTYTPFGNIYTNAPRFVIHHSLRNCSSVIDLAEMAKSKGFEVSFDEGGFVNDIRLNEGFDAGAPVRNHSVRTARRFIEQHPGCA